LPDDHSFLLVSSKSLLAILTPARDVKNLPRRFADIVENRLSRLSVQADVLAAEVIASRNVSIGRTLDRSVIGQMVDFAKALPYYLPTDAWVRGWRGADSIFRIA
jgi:hypothetical protein